MTSLILSAGTVNGVSQAIHGQGGRNTARRQNLKKSKPRTMGTANVAALIVSRSAMHKRSPSLGLWLFFCVQEYYAPKSMCFLDPYNIYVLALGHLIHLIWGTEEIMTGYLGSWGHLRCRYCFVKSLGTLLLSRRGSGMIVGLME